MQEKNKCREEKGYLRKSFEITSECSKGLLSDDDEFSEELLSDGNEGATKTSWLEKLYFGTVV